VLLAEDVAASRYLCSRFLRKAGLQVDEAVTGQQVLQVASASSSQGQAYDLILMDVQMPEMDGLEATRRLRALGWTRPIIALTAHSMAGDCQRCLDAGCDDYLCKPVQEQQLHQTLARYLARPRGETAPR
jgi:CheY-like chemotaxis protein